MLRTRIWSRVTVCSGVAETLNFAALPVPFEVVRPMTPRLLSEAAVRLTLSVTDVAGLPAASGDAGAEFLTGTALADGAPVAVIDVARLFAALQERATA